MDPRDSARRIFDVSGRQVRSATRDVIYPGDDNILRQRVFTVTSCHWSRQSAKSLHRLALTYSISVETTRCVLHYLLFLINFLTLKTKRFME